MNKLFFFLLSITCLSYTAYAQSITNVTATQSGKNIVVSYNLTGKEEIKAYEIKLFISTDGGSTWQGPLTALSGAVGKAQTVGSGKSITWEMLKEPGFSQLIGDNIQFKIKAFYQGLVDIEMVWVEGGSFMMGSNDGEENEKPVHEVTLRGFNMGKYEITQEQWETVMNNNPSYFKGCNNCPVEEVSWNDVQDFIKKLNAQTGKKYRLPTEAEWEYASRGGNKSNRFKYSGSNSMEKVAWYIENSGMKTHPAGQKTPNELGLYDLSGNVMEWCNDWYQADCYNATTQPEINNWSMFTSDKEFHQQNSKRINPQGPNMGKDKVVRGGGFNGNHTNCLNTCRSRGEVNDTDHYVGFRLVKD